MKREKLRGNYTFQAGEKIYCGFETRLPHQIQTHLLDGVLR